MAITVICDQMFDMLSFEMQKQNTFGIVSPLIMKWSASSLLGLLTAPRGRMFTEAHIILSESVLPASAQRLECS